MSNVRRWAVLLLASLVLSSHSPMASASSRVGLTVDKAFQFAPGKVKLRIQVEPNPANRLVRLEWDSDEGSAGLSNLTEFAVDDPPRTVWRTLEHLPPGHYVAAVGVYEADGKSFVASTVFDVLASR